MILARMCGRYTFRDPVAIASALEALGVKNEAAPMAKRYNVAPTQSMPVVITGEHGLTCLSMKWGIVPFFARKERKPMQLINARSETVTSKPTFRQSVQKRRCIVPCDGFFEWKRFPDGTKTPFFIRMKNDAPFWIAGIYEAASADIPAGYALLTTGPNELMASIHDRMPAILDSPAAQAWLKPAPLTQEQVTSFCESHPASQMRADEVSRIVNSARNDVPECVASIL